MTARRPVIDRREVGGATLLTLSQHSLPVVRFVIGLRRGAVGDPEGQSGTTRAMLELMLRGTESKPRAEFGRTLERLGSRVASFCGAEVAGLRGICLRRNLESTWALVGEALTQPAFAVGELEGLMGETVAALYAERDEDDAVAEHFLRPLVYGAHPLSRFPEGTLVDLARLDAPLLRREKPARLVASELVFGFVGDITPAQAATLVEPLVAAGEAAPVARASVARVGDPDGLQILVVDKPARSQVQLRLACPSLTGTDPDVDAFWLGVTAFGGTFTSPLTREVRDKRGWSYVAHAGFARRQRSRAPLVLSSAPALADAIDCAALELSLFADLAHGKLEHDTLDFARTYLLNRYPLDVASAADLLGPAFEYEVLGLSPQEIFRVPERLEALALDAVAPVMRRHLEADRLVMLLVAPAAAVIGELERRFPRAHIRVGNYMEGLQPQEDAS